MTPLETLVRPPVGWVTALLWGAIWGSFFNLAIFRLGLWVEAEAQAEEARPEDERRPFLDEELDHLRWIGLALRSLLRPARSFCPRCQTPIRAVDNIPLLSWLLLGGRCRACRAPISIRYPLVELLGVALGAAIYWRVVIDAPAPAVTQAARFFVYFAFGGTLVVLSAIDLESMLLPDAILFPAIPIFFLAGRSLPDVPTVDALLGIAIGYGGFVAVGLGWRLITGREALGTGDAKLAALVGATLGWRALPWMLVGASVLGVLTVVPIVLVRQLRDRGRKLGEGLRVQVPFGPQLAAAALGYLLLGNTLHALLARWVLGE